nr:PREDICTED: tRNA pseudouridine synthase-like 1 isoform X2 [Bemisia tabaci]
MGRRRFLMYFSYIGKQFSGLQRQITRDRENQHDVTTVQGLLEYALHRLRPENEVHVIPSSRTDQGVHALRSAAHVDLDFKWNFDSDFLTHSLNCFFSQTGVDVRVLETIEVSPHFHSRHLPQWRQYLYRFAVLNNASLLKDNKTANRYVVPLPITEAFRCHFVYDPLWDVNIARKATDIFVGTHDYTSFMARSKGVPPNLKTERTILSCELSPGRPFLPCDISKNWTFWNVRVRGRSFLYKMVRRMVSSLLALGGKKMSKTDIRYLLENPSQDNWPNYIHTVPGYALYLENVYYDPKDYWIEAPVLSTSQEGEDGDGIGEGDDEEEEEEEEEIREGSSMKRSEK